LCSEATWKKKNEADSVKVALQKFGAKTGMGKCLEGNFYALISTEMRKERPHITLEKITDNV
jgi:hypothetical protein